MGGLVVAPLVVLGIMRFVLPQVADGEAETSNNAVRIGALLVAALAAILAFFFLSDLAVTVGRLLAPQLGAFDFLGNFISSLGEILRLALTPICALIGGGLLLSMAGQLGQRMVERVTPSTGKQMNLGLAAVAGATLFALLGAGVNWFYQLGNPMLTLYGPAVVGALGGLLVAARTGYSDSLPCRVDDLWRDTHRSQRAALD